MQGVTGERVKRFWPAAGATARRGVAAVALLGLCACSPIYRNHGYTPSDDELASIRVGSDTRESVASSVGTPSSSGVLRESGYYYVSQRVVTYGARAPQVIDRQVVAITFDQSGVVRNVERYGLEDGKAVALSRRVTDSSVEGLSFIQQLLGSVRAFDPASLFGRGNAGQSTGR